MAPSARPPLRQPTPVENALMEVKKVIVGQDRTIERLFVCLLAR
jgi:MoxR-like ATPase